MPIPNRKTFAKECAIHGLFLGVNSHYLMAVAELRSGIKDDTEGGQIGPFRITQQIWDANGAAANLEIILEPADINNWRLQCLFAALTAYRGQSRLLEQLGQFPSAVELYQEQWPNDPFAKLQDALNATAAFIDPAMEEVLGAPPTDTPTIEDAGGSAHAPISTELPPAGEPPKDSERLFIIKAPRVIEKLISDFGLQSFQAAGILGNIGHECAGFHLMQEVRPLGGGRGGFGWCQWTGSRREKFEEFCTTRGMSPLSDAANYGYLKQELQTTHRASITAVKATTSISAAVRQFEGKFEKAAAAHKHFDRRERWADLAFKNFVRPLPADVLAILDPDTIYKIVIASKSATTNFWVIDEFDEDGGQVLIKKEAGHPPEILARDTIVFPLKAGLVPPAVAVELSKGFELSDDPHPKIPFPPSAPNSDDDVAKLIFAKAKECNSTLITRNVTGTRGGRVACAWAVNEVVRRAVGEPVGGGLSTINMGKALRSKHTLVPEAGVSAGMIVISPTAGNNVGHVGIVGAIKSPVSATTIYSNSSSRGVFADLFTLSKWKAFYGDNKKLPVLFFSLKK